MRRQSLIWRTGPEVVGDNASVRSRPLHVVLNIAGTDRTPARNRWLARMLTFVAGALNSVGFVAVAAYTSHMTGLTAQVADHLVLGDTAPVVAGVTAIVAFIGGAATCALVFNWSRRRRHHARFASVLALQGGLMLLFGALAQYVEWVYARELFIAVIAFTMGLQNAIISKVSDAQIRTTHVTGMVTDIGVELGKLIYLKRPGDPDPVRADVAKLRLHASIVGLFFLGGVVGALGFLWLGYPSVVPLALFVLLVAAGPIAEDLRPALARGRGRS